MLGKVATALIVIFWLTMMALLAQREILPAVRAARESYLQATYNHLEKLTETPRISQMGIFLRGRRIGRSVSILRKDDGALRLQNETEINLSLSPGGALMSAGIGGLHAVIRFRAKAMAGRLLDFRLTVVSPPGTPPLVVVDGYPVGKMLALKIRQAGQTRTKTVPFDASQLLSSSLAPVFALPDLHVGKRWMMRTLDPATYAVRAVWAEVEGKESLSISGREYEAYLIKIPYGSYEVKVWATPDGEVLKQKVFGFTFVREEPPAELLEQGQR